MKQMLLPAILAIGIHAYLLSADFGWIEKKPSLKIRPQITTLQLISAPMPPAEPAPQLSKPAAPPAPESAPEPEPKPRIKDISETRTIPPLPEKQKPSPSMPPDEPVFDSPTEPAISDENPDMPVHEPEPRPTTIVNTFKKDSAGLAEMIETTPVPPEPAGVLEMSPAPLAIQQAAPIYRNNPPPPYPRLARKRGYQGIVVLDVLVDTNGRVADMKVLSSSGYAVLDKAAQTTVENWSFEPGKKGKEKIEMWVQIPIRFQLK